MESCCQIGRYKQTVAPTSEPVTVAEARAQCSLAIPDFDDLLAGFIADARHVIEQRHSRQLMPATWTVTLDEFPCEIELIRTPVTAVSSITYKDLQGVSQTLAASEYQVDTQSRDSAATIMPVYGAVWPNTAIDTLNAVTVTFTAGYANAAAVPRGYRRAILMMVAQMFKYRGMAIDGSQAANSAFEWLIAADDPGGCA